MSRNSPSTCAIYLLAGAIFGAVNAFQWETLNSYDYFTKRIAPNIFAGGWLTTREIEYLAVGGFKSIISTSRFDSGATEYNGVPGEYPSSLEEVKLAKSLGMEAVFFSSELTSEWVNTISAAIQSMPKPVYIHCHAGWAASLFAELHMYESGALNGEDFFDVGLTLGWDYQSDAGAVQLVDDIIGSSTEVTAPSIEQTLTGGEAGYKNYYWSHWFSDADNMWYNTGQPLETQVEAIAAAGYKAVISFRNDGEETTRLPGVDSDDGPINNHEFSDANGMYNVTMEKQAFEAFGIKFFNLPVTGEDAWSAATLAAYSPSMAAAAEAGPVLAHCRVGHRSSAYVVAYLAQQKGLCSPWALQQARRVGFSFDGMNSDASVLQFFADALRC